jgi:hypothetical protein
MRTMQALLDTKALMREVVMLTLSSRVNVPEFTVRFTKLLATQPATPVF